MNIDFIQLGASFRNFLPEIVLGTFFVGTTHDGESFFESNCAYTREGIRRLGLVGFQRECSPEQFEHAISGRSLSHDATAWLR